MCTTRLDSFVGGEPELRLGVRRADGLMRVGFDARGQPHEHARDSGGLHSRDLFEGVEDDERAGVGGCVELLVRFVVAVEHEPVGGNAGTQGKGELHAGGDIGADAFGRKQA
jgi:hypothetical protein